jgi:Family of unknown function (DUF6263)
MKFHRFAAAIIAGAVIVLGVLPGTSLGAQPAAKPAGKVDLRPKFKVGQETRFKIDMDTNGNQSTPGAGEGQPMKQTVGATILFKCRDTNPETGSTLEVVYETLKLKMQSPLASIEFDSSKPANPDDPMDGMIRSIVGTKLNVKMDKDGNITSVDGGGGGAGGMGDQFAGADLMKNMFGPVFTTKKGSGQAAVGEKWTNEDTMEAGNGTVRITTTNTLKSVSGGMATIDIKGAFSLDPSSSGKGITIRDSSLTGEAKWDTEAGMLDSMQMKQKVSVEQKQGNEAPTRTGQDVNMRVQRLQLARPSGATPAPGALIPKNR